jgi:hypothetical protein
LRKKVNIPIPESDLDYGTKPYAAPEAYQGQVRKATSKLEHDNVERQYSEFKRPQAGHDSYNDMEHWADPPPWFVFPDFPFPDIPISEYPVPDFEWGDSFICICGGTGCYCPGEITCFSSNCSYPIVGISLSSMTGGFNIILKKNGFCVDAPEDAKGPIEITYTLLKLKPDGKGGVTKEGTCQTSNIYDQCQPSKCCAGTEDMAWDDETSAETVAQSSSCIVAITDSGDGSPYKWTVSGTGFYFNASHSVTSMQTNNKVIALYTDESACGPATITVVGCGGQVVTGYVRCTAGKWGPDQEGCAIAGDWDSKYCGFSWPSYYCSYTKTSGKYEQIQQIATSYPSGSQISCLSPILCADIIGVSWENESDWQCCFQGDCESDSLYLYNVVLRYREWIC